MKRLVLIAAVIATASPARGWEADTTHAGLTEQAALASTLHDVLTTRFGRELGVYDPVTVGKSTAPALFRKLELLPPSSGLVPDARGRQNALAWLVAGSVLEDLPASRGANHFSGGLTGGGGLAMRVTGGGPPSKGKAARDWILDDANDLSLERFWHELELAVLAATPAERDQHLAFALVTAGAVLHVLEDVGSPSRARGDWDEHTGRLGGGAGDRGSRFERLAALAYGRLGVPAPDGVERRDRAREFFTSSNGKGLSDWAAETWYSSGTLPKSKRAPDGTEDGERRVNGAGNVCKAVVRVERGKQSYTIPDECAAEQMAVILPRVGAYARGMLEWMFRGELALAVDGGVVTVTSPAALGAGAIRVLVDDEKGNREEVGAARVEKSVAAGGVVATFAVPDGAKAVVAVFRGVDEHGEEVVAVGRRGGD